MGVFPSVHCVLQSLPPWIRNYWYMYVYEIIIVDTYNKKTKNSTWIAHVIMLFIDEIARIKALYIHVCFCMFPSQWLWSEIIYLRYKFLGVRDVKKTAPIYDIIRIKDNWPQHFKSISNYAYANVQYSYVTSHDWLV